MNVLCCKTVFHTASGKLYQSGHEYRVHPSPDLSEFFAWPADLRDQLRADRAKQLGRPVDKRKTAAQDAQALIELAHKKAESAAPAPQTLYEITPKPAPAVPTTLAHLSTPDFLG